MDGPLFAHPVFSEQLDVLSADVERLRSVDPVGYVSKNASKRLAAIHRLVFDVIPQDPTRTEYRQGAALGDEHKHWFRAKFFQQYRLFFRYDLASRIIVFAWVNDSASKHAYESASDAYRTFNRMLKAGRPPDDWSTLLAEAKRSSRQRPLKSG